MTNINDILQELKRGLQEIYGPRLVALYLYGSRARGDADEDSDIDVAMVLDGERTPAEREKTSELVAAICLEHTCLIQLVSVQVADWKDRDTLFLNNVRREGRRVA